MSTVYDAIYEKAKPYRETRQNNVHVPIVYDLARRLLTHYPEADESIVLPAILLHDVGWNRYPDRRRVDSKQQHLISGICGPRTTEKSL